MARIGLGDSWHCVLANEWSSKKAAAYRRYFQPTNDEFIEADVASLQPSDLPSKAILSWASFPCQDLSLAGNYAGLNGQRSGTFKTYWHLMRSLVSLGRSPEIVVLENVAGTLSSHGGRDFEFLIDQLTSAGYVAGALVIDAIHFLPQSRPRLFIVGVRSQGAGLEPFLQSEPSEPWHPKALVAAYDKLPEGLKRSWRWWRLPAPPRVSTTLAGILEANPSDVHWHTPAETEKLLGMMSDLNLQKISEMRSTGRKLIGTVYRRTRPTGDGEEKVQRAELRVDGVAGCLRTPGGGSSRQTVLVVEGDRVQTRLLSAREAARLMGLPEDYSLPSRYNEAYHLIGDGLAVPVVSWLSAHLLTPLAQRLVGSEPTNATQT